MRGVYRVPIAGASLVLGARYQLHVARTAGEEVTAFTRIPRADVRATGGLTRTLNRDHDALAMQWNAAPQARAHTRCAWRVRSGRFFFSPTARHSTDRRSAKSVRRRSPARLHPGFRQDIIVAAVDSNFYDYYRTNNDPFTGAGIISRINGGIGMFGSIVTLESGTLTVIADQTEPIEGRYRFIGRRRRAAPRRQRRT